MEPTERRGGPTATSDNPPSAPAHPNVPNRRAVALAFASVVLAGVLGAAVGWGLVDAGYVEATTTARLVGALVAAAVCTLGAGVVAVLMLRAMAEWRSHPASGDATRRHVDWKVVALGVLSVGVVVALVVGALLTVASRTGPVTCGAVRRDAAALETDLAQIGPLFVSAGGDCAYWAVLEDGSLAAYSLRVDGCLLDYDRGRDEFRCDGVAVDRSEIPRLRAEVRAEDGEQVFVVDLTGTASTADG